VNYRRRSFVTFPLHLCSERSVSIFWLGRSRGVIGIVWRRITWLYLSLRVAGHYHGYFDKDGEERV
jgi:UDP-N-acetyl-D-mannosaminuronic acid transferase (WecB/TagA/CpsF family)